jgi:hypothetical protein
MIRIDPPPPLCGACGVADTCAEGADDPPELTAST